MLAAPRALQATASTLCRPAAGDRRHRARRGTLTYVEGDLRNPLPDHEMGARRRGAGKGMAASGRVERRIGGAGAAMGDLVAERPQQQASWLF